MARETSYGVCELCGKRSSKAAITRHLQACAAQHEKSGKGVPLFHLRVEGRHEPYYWLDIEIKAAARLSDLDQFLRCLWLECCGHLSAFRIGNVDYEVPDTDPLGGFGEFFSQRVTRSIDTGVGRALRAVNGHPFGYEYDFGSTTELKIRRVAERVGRIGSSPLRLLARNEGPVWPCSICGQPATHICPDCTCDSDDPFLCGAHAEAHECEYSADEMLPVVNSPRLGVCCYRG